MFPEYDPVCVLRVKPFATMHDKYKKQLLELQRPTPAISISKTVKNVRGSYNRKFKESWYEQHPWLCASVYLQKLFCWPCVLLSNKVTAWNKFGFEDISNVARSLRTHEGTMEHLKCELSFKQLTKNTFRFADALVENNWLCNVKFNENVRLNRQFMELPIDAVLYLAKHELQFHDVNNSKPDNFTELLTILVSRSTLDMRTHYQKLIELFSSSSEIIQKGIIKCINDYIREYITTELNEAPFFSIQVDDSSEFAQKSQCSVITRYVNSSGELVERFCGFHDVNNERTADTFSAFLQKFLKHPKKLVAQCYDGATVLSNHLNGLQEKIKEEAPEALLVNCLAHRFNVILQQSLRHIPKCRFFFANIEGIGSFFHHSPKIAVIADSLTESDTKVTSSSRVLKIVNSEWNSVKHIFEKLMVDPTSDQKSIRQSQGFVNQFNDFEFTFLVLVFTNIFDITDVLDHILKTNSFNATQCLLEMKAVNEKVLWTRNKGQFKKLFEAATARTKMNGSDDEMFENCKLLYYEITDTILSQLDTRFQDMGKLTFVSLANTTKFFEYSSKNPTVTVLDQLKLVYASKFNDMECHRLRNELEIIYSDPQYRDKTLQEVLKLLQEHKEILKESYKLFSLILTLPSTTSSIDGSSSCLRRVEAYLKNWDRQTSFPRLARISIEKGLLTELQRSRPFFDDIIDKFATLEEIKIDLICKK